MNEKDQQEYDEMCLQAAQMMVQKGFEPRPARCTAPQQRISINVPMPGEAFPDDDNELFFSLQKFALVRFVGPHGATGFVQNWELLHQGYRVLSAHESKEAAETARTDEFQFVIEMHQPILLTLDGRSFDTNVEKECAQMFQEYETYVKDSYQELSDRVQKKTPTSAPKRSPFAPEKKEGVVREKPRVSMLKAPPISTGSIVLVAHVPKVVVTGVDTDTWLDYSEACLVIFAFCENEAIATTYARQIEDFYPDLSLVTVDADRWVITNQLNDGNTWMGMTPVYHKNDQRKQVFDHSKVRTVMEDTKQQFKGSRTTTTASTNTNQTPSRPKMTSAQTQAQHERLLAAKELGKKALTDPGTDPEMIQSAIETLVVAASDFQNLSSG